jgi:hypothetical protein
VRSNVAPLLRYYDLRRRVLGLDELHQYDTYVPLVPEIETHVSFDEAIDKVVAALAPLGDEYVRTLADGLRNRWCDRYETKGKRSGAFSSGSYGAPPYILMNYKEDVFSDVYTLAHEAGHSMHTWFSQRSQRYQDYNYPIFLAEVASTFNEELLTHYLLEQTDDAKMRAYIINRQIDDIRGTLFGRRCSPSSRRSSMRSRSAAMRLRSRCSNPNTALSCRPTSAKAWCSIRSSTSSASASRTSTARFTSTSMRQESPRLSRYQSVCWPVSRAASMHI